MEHQFENFPLPPDWDRRQGERVRKNEAAFKAHNERRKALEQPLARSDERIPFVCECGDAGCWDAVELTIEEFNQAHATAMRYAVKPLHVMPDYERVVGQHESYWIVEKFSPDQFSEAASTTALGSASL
jgi:hypothetical protein